MTAGESPAEDGQSFEPLVIAVLDSGTNPYLSVFESVFPVGPAVNAPYRELNISQTGTISEREDLDASMWEQLEFATLYHFEDTRLLAISFAQGDAPINQDGSNHGAATSYLLAREAPLAIIVSVQISLGICRAEPNCIVDPSVAEGMEWIAEQSWIDVVSVSLGLPGNPPDDSALHPEYARFLAASEKAARDGKLLVTSAGNEIASPTTGYFAGPPWVIAVGGAESQSTGESLLAGKGVDIVANFTDRTPKVLSEELEWSSGTSLATPIVAGTLANALHMIRQSQPDANVSAQQLRDALNATGVYFSPTDWDPTPSDRGPFGFAPIYGASLPVLVQPQMGWGYVDGSFAGEIARRVLENDLAPPPEKQQAILFQAEWQKAREEYWAKAR